MIVAVAGGKGGTGKTLVSTSLALAMAPLQFLDCDVEEPNAHLFLKPVLKKWEQVTITVPHYQRWRGEVCLRGADFCRYQALAVVDDRMLIFPELCTGCGGCFLLCPEGGLQPVEHQLGVVKTGVGRNGIGFVTGELRVGQQRTTEVITAVKERMNPGDNSIIDCPPGNNRPLRTAVADSNYCIMVCEPTPFGLHDIKDNKKLLDMMNIPSGVVINRSGGGFKKLGSWCEEEGVPILLEIPFDFNVARAAARGLTLPDIDSSWEERLQSLWSDIENIVR